MICSNSIRGMQSSCGPTVLPYAAPQHCASFSLARWMQELGEVEIEPLRVDVVGELAYEAGRCKALIPSATGKRREERGKYLWVCARQNNGEWKLAADCWSSDLTLSTLESDVPQSTGVKTSVPRKNP